MTKIKQILTGAVALTLAALPVAAQAADAGKLSIVSHARVGKAAAAKNKAVGGGVLIALLAAAAVVAGIVVVADSDDDSKSS